MSVRYYVKRNSERFGPYSSSQLRQMAAQRRLRPSDIIAQEGTAKSMAASNVKGLFAQLPPNADEVSQSPSASVTQQSLRSLEEQSANKADLPAESFEEFETREQFERAFKSARLWVGGWLLFATVRLFLGTIMLGAGLVPGYLVQYADLLIFINLAVLAGALFIGILTLAIKRWWVFCIGGIGTVLFAINSVATTVEFALNMEYGDLLFLYLQIPWKMADIAIAGTFCHTLLLSRRSAKVAKRQC